jgi:flavorubredoxin
VTDKQKEEEMHPLVLDYIVHQHIEDLHREAAVRRLARRSRKHKSHVRKAAAMRLSRAPAH